MIFDKTSNLNLYASLIPHLDEILEFARTASQKPVGTYPYPRRKDHDPGGGNQSSDRKRL